MNERKIHLAVEFVKFSNKLRQTPSASFQSFHVSIDWWTKINKWKKIYILFTVKNVVLFFFFLFSSFYSHVRGQEKCRTQSYDALPILICPHPCPSCLTAPTRWTHLRRPSTMTHILSSLPNLFLSYELFPICIHVILLYYIMCVCMICWFI